MSGTEGCGEILYLHPDEKALQYLPPMVGRRGTRAFGSLQCALSSPAVIWMSSALSGPHRPSARIPASLRRCFGSVWLPLAGSRWRCW